MVVSMGSRLPRVGCRRTFPKSWTNRQIAANSEPTICDWRGFLMKPWLFAVFFLTRIGSAGTRQDVLLPNSGVYGKGGGKLGQFVC